MTHLNRNVAGPRSGERQRGAGRMSQIGGPELINAT